MLTFLAIILFCISIQNCSVFIFLPPWFKAYNIVQISKISYNIVIIILLQNENYQFVSISIKLKSNFLSYSLKSIFCITFKTVDASSFYIFRCVFWEMVSNQFSFAIYLMLLKRKNKFQNCFCVLNECCSIREKTFEYASVV